MLHTTEVEAERPDLERLPRGVLLQLVGRVEEALVSVEGLAKPGKEVGRAGRLP